MDTHNSRSRASEDEYPDPQSALRQIKRKLRGLVQEYAAGALNAGQFNALYSHYVEKRTIIERLIERNPDTDAWRAAASAGKTTFLRQQFESRLLFCAVLRRGSQQPLLVTGKLPRKAAERLHRMLRVIWSLEEWHPGTARKSLGDNLWLLMTLGANAMTVTVFFMQPSDLQIDHVRDLHTDFETANQRALNLQLPAERMVFPQRSLLERRGGS